MLSIDELEHPRSRNCGRDLVTFYWGTVATACSSNVHCQAYKQPQKIEGGERNGEKGKTKEDGSEEGQEKLRVSQKRT